MKLEIEDNISAKLLSGGVQEYIETGNYPRKLRIESEKYDASWNVEVQSSKMDEVLKLNDKSLYRIKFLTNEEGQLKLEIQELTNKKPTSEWIPLNYEVLMLD